MLFISTGKSEAGLYLNNLDFTAQINEDGSMNVVETWDIDISETNTLYKTFEIDKSKYRELKDISVTEITRGTNKAFRETKIWEYHIDKNYYFGGINQDGKYEIAWGVGLDNSSDTRIYLISYTVEDAIKKYGDCAELYWQFVGEDFEVNANSITGIIKLPNHVSSKDEIKVWGHTEYLNGEIYATSTDTVEFNINKYQSGNFVEVRIAMPNYIMATLPYTSTQNKLDSIIAEETAWAEEANAKRAKRDRNMKTIAYSITVIIAGAGIWFSTKIKKYHKALKENPKIVPDMLDYYRELPDETATPAEAYFVLNKMQDISKTLCATILDLTLKGYLKAEQVDKKIEFEIVEKDRETLPEDEKQVLELLEKACENKENEKKIVKMKDLEKYIEKYPGTFEKLKNKIDEISKEKSTHKGKFDKKIAEKAGKYILKLIGYITAIVATINVTIFGSMYIFVVGDMGGSLKYILLAGLFIGIVLLINIIMCSKLISRFNGFTQKGENEREQWKAFKKYMEDFSLLNEKEVPHLVIWEKYLVYATAFGIADKVIKQLKIKYPELENPDNMNNLVLFSIMSGPNGLNTNFISSLNTSTSHMYSSTYSSGSGSGGGFSGGGGGRRPVGADKPL